MQAFASYLQVRTGPEDRAQLKNRLALVFGSCGPFQATVSVDRQTTAHNCEVDTQTQADTTLSVVIVSY